ncbi:conserved hypothetical protein [delta proteobacterium NaphS2]|nr:conserved hypothetical protein [delta proteobacterium NaphS2]
MRYGAGKKSIKMKRDNLNLLSKTKELLSSGRFARKSFLVIVILENLKN